MIHHQKWPHLCHLNTRFTCREISFNIADLIYVLHGWNFATIFNIRNCFITTGTPSVTASSFPNIPRDTSKIMESNSISNLLKPEATTPSLKNVLRRTSEPYQILPSMSFFQAFGTMVFRHISGLDYHANGTLRVRHPTAPSRSANSSSATLQTTEISSGSHQPLTSTPVLNSLPSSGSHQPLISTPVLNSLLSSVQGGSPLLPHITPNMTPHLSAPYCITPLHPIPHYNIPQHTTLYPTTKHFITLHNTTSNHAALYCAALHCILHQTIRTYSTLDHTTLHYITSLHHNISH